MHNLRSPPDMNEAIRLSMAIHSALVAARALQIERIAPKSLGAMLDVAATALEALNEIAAPVGIAPKVVDIATARAGRDPEPRGAA